MTDNTTTTDQKKSNDRELINDLLFGIQNILSESDYKDFIDTHLTESQRNEYK